METEMARTKPEWNYKYKETNEKMKEALEISTFLKKKYEERTKVLFDDKANVKLQNQIFESQTKINQVNIEQILKTCETNVIEISRSQVTSSTEKQIKSNVQLLLVNKLKEITSIIKKQEQEYFTKLKEYGNDTNLIEEFKNSDSNDNIDTNQEGNSASQQLLMQRNTELSNLAKSMNDLAIIFKEVSVLTFEQSEIINKIDNNIDSTLKYTNNANKQLTTVIFSRLKNIKNLEYGGACFAQLLQLLLCSSYLF